VALERCRHSDVRVRKSLSAREAHDPTGAPIYRGERAPGPSELAKPARSRQDRTRLRFRSIIRPEDEEPIRTTTWTNYHPAQ